MTDPGDQRAAAAGSRGRGRLRASHADREQAIEALKLAFVQDRLTKDELDMRVGRVLAARTCAELAALTADVPPAPAGTGPERPPSPARRRPLARAAAGSGGCLVIAAAAVWAAFILDPGPAMADPIGPDVHHHPHQVPRLATAARSIMTRLRGGGRGSGRATLVRVAAPPAAVAAGNDASANAANAIWWASQHGGQAHQLATTAENHASSCCG